MMEFWTKVAAIAAVGQVVVLIVTAWFVRGYLRETIKLRLAAQRQADLANEQREAQIRPALTVVADVHRLLVTNVGSGTAFNLRLVRTKGELDWEAKKSNFGELVKGAAVPVGQAPDTGEKVGFMGSITGERLDLIYESLSGKVYASIVTFEGSGQPSRVIFLTEGEQIAGVTYPALGTTREA